MTKVIPLSARLVSLLLSPLTKRAWITDVSKFSISHCRPTFIFVVIYQSAMYRGFFHLVIKSIQINSESKIFDYG